MSLASAARSSAAASDICAPAVDRIIRVYSSIRELNRASARSRVSVAAQTVTQHEPAGGRRLPESDLGRGSPVIGAQRELCGYQSQSKPRVSAFAAVIRWPRGVTSAIAASLCGDVDSDGIARRRRCSTRRIDCWEWAALEQHTARHPRPVSSACCAWREREEQRKQLARNSRTPQCRVSGTGLSDIPDS